MHLRHLDTTIDNAPIDVSVFREVCGSMKIDM